MEQERFDVLVDEISSLIDKVSELAERIEFFERKLFPKPDLTGLAERQRIREAERRARHGQQV